MDDFQEDGTTLSDHSRMLSDLELVELLKRGDSSAFEQLFLSYYSALVQFALRYARDRAAAQDIVQDVFARIWERRTEIMISTSVQSYLYSAVRNQAVTQLRRMKTQEDWEVISLDSDSVSGSRSISLSADIHYDAIELNQLVDRVVSSLPERCQEIFSLYVDSRLSQLEISDVLEIAHSTVRVQISRAMTAVRKAVSNHINPDK